MTVSRSCGQRCGIPGRHRGAGRLRRCVAERLAGQLAGPAHPRGCGLGVVAELLRDPSGADLAVATWSADWNYGPGWDRLLLDAYGIRPDPERTRYYRLLWDLSS